MPTMSDAPELSFVLPCHNERDNLRPLVGALRSVAERLGRSFEIVVTDDASEDGSWEVLRELARVEPRLRAQRFASRCGQSAALWAGLQAARGRVVVTMDADLQNDPEDLPRLLEPLGQFDCVCGSRVASRRQGDNLLRVVASRIANGVRNRLTGESISDAGCCYRAFKRECLGNIKFFRGMHRFLPTLLRMEGYAVTEVPIRTRPRQAGQTHYGVWNRLFASFQDLLAVRWMKKRLLRYEIAERLN